MGGYHALTHLIKENLVEKVKPFTIGGAIAGTGKPSYVPVPSSPAQIDVAPTMADGEEAAAVPDGWRPVHDMGTGGTTTTTTRRRVRALGLNRRRWCISVEE